MKVERQAQSQIHEFLIKSYALTITPPCHTCYLQTCTHDCGKLCVL